MDVSPAWPGLEATEALARGACGMCLLWLSGKRTGIPLDAFGKGVYPATCSTVAARCPFDNDVPCGRIVVKAPDSTPSGSG